MSVDQIELARVKLLSNAERLFVEANLLFDHGHYARAYTLAHLCSEELSKIPMLVSVGLQLVEGSTPIDWQKLERRMRSHTTKIDATHTHDYFRSEIRSDDSDVRAYEAALNTTAELNRLKNTSLYAEQQGAEFVEPTDVIGKSEASAALHQTEQRLTDIRTGEAATRGKIATSAVAAKLQGKLRRKEI